MLLFDKTFCCDICLLNTNAYVRLAAEDLCRDFARVSAFGVSPRITKEITEGCIVIEENTLTDYEPAEHEGFYLRTEGDRLILSAEGYLGTMWGIYTVCERLLGISPCYLFEDLRIEKKENLSIGDIEIREEPKGFLFRGAFINDEDLLTGFRDGGGIRKLDFPWYSVTVEESAIRMVVETALRLKLNLIIPASFLDIENPPEKLLADVAAARGIYVSQHHIEPLGVSAFTFKNYLEKQGESGEFSYQKNPKQMEKAWEYYAKKWAGYKNVVWQIGLRGEGDRPVWQESIPSEQELAAAGEFISRAYEKQKEIVMAAAGGRAKYFTSTLWMEGSILTEKGYLRFPENTVIVFADTGPTQMFGKEFYSLERRKNDRYGIYYHLQYFDSGPHLAPQTGLDKLYYNLRLAYDKGDNSYCIMNVSNVREFTFELAAYARMALGMEDFSKEAFIGAYCKKFAPYEGEMAALIDAYYKNLPFASTALIKFHGHSKYFNFFIDEVSEDFHNLTLKEGDLLGRGSHILYHFSEDSDAEEKLCEAYFEAVKKAIPVYENLFDRFESLAKKSSDRIAEHIRLKWMLYVKTLACIYKWYTCVYKAREYCLGGQAEKMKSALYSACESLEEYLKFRKCAEVGAFENWYRGDLKMNVFQRLCDTRRRLGQTPRLI